MKKRKENTKNSEIRDFCNQESETREDFLMKTETISVTTI